ncbi:DUF362 domain-containing protein [Chloroflexota bacterium]
MVFEVDEFVFEPPYEVAFARRVLLKPAAAYPLPHPVTTSRETLAAVIRGIRKVSDADILLLEGSSEEESVLENYRSLGYDFPRILTLDVRDCFAVEVENPLPRPFALPTFWLPNVVLACDFLVSVAPFKIVAGMGHFNVMNMLGVLATAKYGGITSDARGLWQRFGLQNLVADLYFTLPFDIGIVDGRSKFSSSGDLTQGDSTEYGKIFVADPYDADLEASQEAGVDTPYLRLIKEAKASQEAQ